MDQEQRRREKLYMKFRADLVSGHIASGYDENDLIEIYDYANDIYDEYVQMEVILSGARIYPESEELAQRRAFFLYTTLSMTEGAVNIAMNHKGETALWAILLLLVKHPPIEESIKEMNSIVDTFADFDDETIIQLVDACVELELYDWLKENRELIKKRCLYPDTFLYELSQVADGKRDHEFGISVLEELTMLEPFNSLYWHMLAQQYVNNDDYNNALQAIDYALAIDPKSTNMLVTKAQILYDMNQDREKARSMMREVLLEDPDNALANHTLAAMLALDGNTEGALAIIRNYLKEHPGDKEAIDHLLTIGNREVDNEEINRYFKSGALSTEQEWVAWADTFYQREQYQACADILLCRLYNTDSLFDWTQLLESLYRCGRYAEVVELYRKYVLRVRDISGLSLSLPDALIMVLSLLREGYQTAAKELADFIVNYNISDINPYEKRLVAIGVQSVLRNILDAIDSSQDVPLSSIDPFA